MKLSRQLALGTAVALPAGLLWTISAYARDMRAARRRASTGSRVVTTKSGPIEVAETGSGPAVLLVHGAGGGFDQGLLLGKPIAAHGFRIIAVSRFGYLRTPQPADPSPEAQADAHAALLDALGLDQVAIVGVSAGGPSTVQFCLRHPGRCSAMVLLVPLAYSEQPARELSPSARFILEKSLSSDFVFWAASRLLRTPMVETILGTPIAAVHALPRDEQRGVYEVLDSILPVSARAQGLINDTTAAQSLRPLPLERIAVPTLIASLEDDRYRTLAGARYAAERIPGARLITYPKGGHLWVGHQEELAAEVAKFLLGTRAGVTQAAREGAGVTLPSAR